MSDDRTPAAKKWLKRLESEKTAHELFRKQAKEAEQSYYDSKKDTGSNVDTMAGQAVPMFWSNTKVLHSALFSRMPRPDVRKRNIDVMDGAAKEISLMTERALTFVMDTSSYDVQAHQSVDDFLIAGLGQSKIEMDVETQGVPIINPMTGQPIVGEDGAPITQTVVASRTIRQIYFYWDNFRWEPTTKWDQVSWVSFDHWMGCEELERRFDVELPKREASGADQSRNKLEADKYEQQYCVHEIWDKTRREVIFISDAYPDILETNEDPLGLDGFFPCPRPMMANVKGSEVIPKPDFMFIKRVLRLINLYSKRIEALTGQLKDWGYYDQSFSELDKVNQASDGTYFPIKGLADRLGLAGGNMNGQLVASIDNTKKAQVIANLIDQVDRQRNLLWELIGLADIMRGSSNPNETASAQRIKNQWSNVRLAPYMNTISQFFRDCFRIIAELICEKFEPEQILQMTGVQVTPEMEQIMQSDFLRAYAVDVETDSTIAQDDNLEREQRNETTQTISQMLQTLVPAMQAGQLPADLGKALLLFAVRTTKFGREFEDAINQLPDTQAQMGQMQQQAQQAQQQAEQLGQQLQEAQGQLQQVNAQEEQRANIKTQTDAQDTSAAAQLKQVQAAKLAQEVQQAQFVPILAQ